MRMERSVVYIQVLSAVYTFFFQIRIQQIKTLRNYLDQVIAFGSFFMPSIGIFL